MTEMTFEEFMQLEEEREKQRRIKRLAEELKPVTSTASKPKPSAAEKKAAQRALKHRIMSDAQKRWEECCKKKYDHLSQPPNGAVAWLVFDRATGELYGEETAWRAYEAWSKVNPMKIVAEKPGKEFLVAIGFNACRCVLRSEWEAAEEKFRQRKSNGNGV